WLTAVYAVPILEEFRQLLWHAIDQHTDLWWVSWITAVGINLILAMGREFVEKDQGLDKESRVAAGVKRIAYRTIAGMMLTHAFALGVIITASFLPALSPWLGGLIVANLLHISGKAWMESGRAPPWVLRLSGAFALTSRYLKTVRLLRLSQRGP